MGRKAGLSKEEFQSLQRLNKKDFEYREWVALTYAREWAFAKGSEPSAEFSSELNRLYTKKDRARILKLLRMMFFFNYCGNWYFKRPWNKGQRHESCALPGVQSEED